MCILSRSPVLQPDATWEPMPSLVKDAQGHTRHSASRVFTYRSERGPGHFLFFPWAVGVIQEKMALSHSFRKTQTTPRPLAHDPTGELGAKSSMPALGSCIHRVFCPHCT